MRRLLCLLLFAACGDDSLAKRSAPRSDCELQSQSFEVSPAVVQRGADVPITVEWAVYGELEPPVIATLRVGDAGDVEVDVPLVFAGGSGLWRGTQRNPFGLGTPAGFVSVLARADAGLSCDGSASAATSFMLE